MFEKINVFFILNPFQAKDAQGSPGQGRGMPPGSLSRGFDMFSRHPSIADMLVFTIIFDVYDTYGANVSDHMSIPYSFSFNCHK